MKYLKEYELNERLDENQVDYIVNQFFNRAQRSLSPTIYQRLGGTYLIDNIFRDLRKTLKEWLINMEDGENTRNFSIRFIKVMKNRILYPTIVQRLGGTYILSDYWIRWRIILTELIDDQTGEIND